MFCANPFPFVMICGSTTANSQPPSEALVVYIFMLLKADYSKEQIIQQITPDMATTFKSFYDKLIEEGMEKGMEKGTEGTYLEKVKTIQRMHSRGFEAEEIAPLVELSVAAVKEILAGGV